MSYCRYRSALKNMTLTETRVAKVVKDRVVSAAFHPCTSTLLVAAGDKWGRVGLWKLVCVHLYVFLLQQNYRERTIRVVILAS